MNRNAVRSIVLLALLTAVYGETVTVQRGPVEEWSTYRGSMTAERMTPVRSPFAGNAVLVGLAEEGAQAEPGDVLVEFDRSSLEHEMVRLERSLALAEAEWRRVSMGRQPLESADLRLARLQVQADLRAERRFLEDSRTLLQEDLVSTQEVARQAWKVDRLQERLGLLDEKERLTRESLHPAELDALRARLDAARREVALAREALSHCTVRAPEAGVVVYPAVHVGSDYRRVRVGDIVFKNQVFLYLTDRQRLKAECLVPESELSNVAEGRPCRVRPVAWPDRTITGVVARVGLMAQQRPDRRDERQYFPVTVHLREQTGSLQNGLTVLIDILKGRRDAALLLPRKAVLWEQNQPYAVTAARPDRPSPLRLGLCTEEAVEVLDGLPEGAEVVVP